MTSTDALTLAFWACVAVLAYVHVGYPLLVALLARAVPARSHASGETPTVALVVAAYDEAQVIEAKVANALDLDYPGDRLSLIVVCDGSGDATAALAQQAGGHRATVLHDPIRRGKAAALNRGAAVASARILVFSDANAMYARGALRALVRAFDDPDVALASGHKTVRRDGGSVGEGESVYWTYESRLRRDETRMGSTVAVVGEMLAIRSELFEPFPDSVVCDDVYLCMRMLATRRRVVFVPEAVSVESASATLADEFARRRKIASARWQLLFRPQWWPWRNRLAMFELVSHKLLRLPVPFLLAAAFLLALAAVLRGSGPLMAACLAAQAGVYVLAIAGLLGRAASRFPGAASSAYFVVGNLANAVGLLDFARGRVTPLWHRVRRNDMPFPG